MARVQYAKGKVAFQLVLGRTELYVGTVDLEAALLRESSGKATEVFFLKAQHFCVAISSEKLASRSQRLCRGASFPCEAFALTAS